MKKSRFTLIEIIIALGICAIGVCSIMVLFPIGATASRDAAMTGYAANTAEQMLNFAKYCILNSDAAFTYFTNDRWDINDTATYIDGTTYRPEYEGEELEIITSTVESTLRSLFDGSGTELKFYGNNIYRVSNIKQDLAEYDCFIWIRPSKITFTTTDGTQEIIPRAVTLHLEISWPAALPYAKRQKAEYHLDIFNPLPES